MKIQKAILFFMKHLFYFFIFWSVLLISCDDRNAAKPKVFWMDNPTSSPIMVVIDDMNYELPANSGANIEINFGKHTLTYNGETVRFVVKPNDQNCVINPTLSNYIFYNEMYVVEGREDKVAAEYEKIKKAYLFPFVLETNDTISVPFKVIQNTLFIEQYEYFWHFGVTQPYTNVRLNMDNTSAATVNRSKVFREDDFLKYIGIENLPKGFVIKPAAMKLSDLKPYEYISDDVIAGCINEKEALEKIKIKFDSLQIITEPVRFRELYLYELNRDLSDVNGRVREGASDDDRLNCIHSFIAMMDRKPSFGMMNAYVVK